MTTHNNPGGVGRGDGNMKLERTMAAYSGNGSPSATTNELPRNHFNLQDESLGAKHNRYLLCRVRAISPETQFGKRIMLRRE